MNARATSSARSSGQLATRAAIWSPAGSWPESAAPSELPPGEPTSGGAVAGPGRDHRLAQSLDVVEQVLAAGLAQHLAEHVAEQPDIAAHPPG